MKKLSLLTIGLLSGILSFAQLNLTFRSHLPFPTQQLSNIWGYAAGGKEYALVGHEEGMSVVDVTNPDNPILLHSAPGPTSIWREVRTKDHYAFVTTEGGDGLQVVDLQYLPDSIVYKQYYGDGAINGQINNIHALHVDGNFLYLYGASTIGKGGALFIDVTDPWNPTFAGQFQNWYVHDGIVRNDTAYFGHINDGFFTVVDVTNKSNPILMAQQNTPNNFTHNTWLTDDSKVLLTTDEVNDAYVASYDVSDLSNIQELDRVQHNPGTLSVPHNTYILNDYAVTSWYKEGVVIIDADRPHNLVVTGYYDTSPLQGAGMDGDWGVYAYLPSGNLLISDMQEGLFVLTPAYQRACYLEGMVTDSACGGPVSGVSITINGPGVSDVSALNGSFAMGTVQAGTYSVTFSKSGYASQTFNGLNFVNGNLLTLNVSLVGISTVAYTGAVSNQLSTPLSGVTVNFKNASDEFTFTTDANGQFNTCSMISGLYDVTAGKWGYHTNCVPNVIVSTGSNSFSATLVLGYMDDFSMDLGWDVGSFASLGEWERGIPVGTTYNGAQANPSADVSNDCGGAAFVTGVNGGNVGDNDLDNGWTMLKTPMMDLSQYGEPHLEYSRWFYNASSQQQDMNDSLIISVFNGVSTVYIEKLTLQNTVSSTWTAKDFKLSDYINITNTMFVSFYAVDASPGHIFEAGIDAFKISDANPPILSTKEPLQNAFAVFPNPSGTFWTLRNPADWSGTLVLRDVLGKVVYLQKIEDSNGMRIPVPEVKGLYFLSADNRKGQTQVLKLIAD